MTQLSSSSLPEQSLTLSIQTTGIVNGKMFGSTDTQPPILVDFKGSLCLNTATMSLTANDLQLLEELLDRKLDEKLDQKLDEKLEEKFAAFAIELENKFATKEELDEKLSAFATKDYIDSRFDQFAVEMEDKFATRDELFEILQAISDKIDHSDTRLTKVEVFLSKKFGFAA